MDIKVLDALMGKGKTSWAIQYMNEADSEERFIVITPFLTEIERIKNSVSSRDIVSPETKSGAWSKTKDLKVLLQQGENIVATHALFKRVDSETLELIRIGGYTLILDEVMDVLEKKDITTADYSILFERTPSLMEVDELTGVCSWSDPSYTGRYEDYKRWAGTGNLILHKSREKESATLLYWSFPVEAFKSFRSVFILTYLFDGQIQRYYYDMYKVKYEKVSVKKVGERYELTDYVGTTQQERDGLKELIHIYEGNLNNIGKPTNTREQPLSKSRLNKWKEESPLLYKSVGDNAVNFYLNHAGSVSSKDVMWTCTKDHEKGLGRKGFKKSFVAMNTRATNELQDKKVCIYLVNRFIHTPTHTLLQKRLDAINSGVTVSNDVYALSELLQWLFRSRIRNGQTVELYIPSERMRLLLKQYLAGDLSA